MEEWFVKVDTQFLKNGNSMGGYFAKIFLNKSRLEGNAGHWLEEIMSNPRSRFELASAIFFATLVTVTRLALSLKPLNVQLLIVDR